MNETVDVRGLDIHHEVQFNGGAGTDSAYLPGHWSDYNISSQTHLDGATWLVFDRNHGSGVDIVLEATNVENFYFVADGTSTPITAALGPSTSPECPSE